MSIVSKSRILVNRFFIKNKILFDIIKSLCYIIGVYCSNIVLLIKAMRVNTEALRYYRNKENLSQKELSEKTGISYQMISAIDRGNERKTASEKVLSAVAVVLHVNLQDLVLNDEDVFSLLDDKTKKHLYEQGYTPDSWEAYNAPVQGPTNTIEDDIDKLNHILGVTGFSVDRTRSNIKDGCIVIKNGTAAFLLPIDRVNQFIESFSDFASFTLNRTIQSYGKSLSPSFALSDEE